MSDLSVLIDQYARGMGKNENRLVQILHEIDRLLHTETPSDPSVPEKVWVIHYSNYSYATADEDEAMFEVGRGHAARYSGPYRLIPA